MATEPPAGIQPDLDRALRIAAAAVKLTNEKEAESLRTLAKIHFLRGSRAEAERAYDQAIGAAEADIRRALEQDRAAFFKTP
jgi:hypothetical protein